MTCVGDRACDWPFFWTGSIREYKMTCGEYVDRNVKNGFLGFEIYELLNGHSEVFFEM